MRPVILAIGGFDPSGGAGVVADAAAARAAGGYAVVVPTVLTVQTTATFGRIVPIQRRFVEEAADAALASHDVGAVKIGLLGSRAAAETALSLLLRNPGLLSVVDPVLNSSTGAPLLPKAARTAFDRILARATLLTPNIPEAEALLSRTIDGSKESAEAARELSAKTGASVLLKGGHLEGRHAGTDILATDGIVVSLPPEPPRRRRDAHGTGCALASAIATRLAAGDGLVDAVIEGRKVLARMYREGFPSAEGRWTLYS